MKNYGPNHIPLFQVDAFTDRPFSGNPAAVCLLEDEPSTEWMQLVAAEMNLSETAFVWLTKQGFGLRWFTPVVEVDLCGHATLAAAHALWESGRLAHDQTACFHTRSGRLIANRVGERIEMDFPSEPANASTAPPELVKALPAELNWSGKNRFDWLVELESETAVRGICPDLIALETVTKRGIIVTAQSDGGGHDFVSRFFAPACGIAEDPVTGSAHCCLGPFWAKRLGKTKLAGYQASQRGGTVFVCPDGNRVLLGGDAITVFSGTLHATSTDPPGDATTRA